jgi:invasion protein IalB
VAAPFARCVPSGCFADFEVKDDTLKKFRAGSGGGKLSPTPADTRSPFRCRLRVSSKPTTHS